MGIVVQKFGGSSVADVKKLELVSERIIDEVDNGNQVVVVVSAQGKTTDKLIFEESEITKEPSKREHDVLVSVGEQITISKLAMVLQKKGYKAVSLTGWQIPIITNNEHTNGRIRYIHKETILELLNSGNIVIVAGFQGINENNEIVTLGRGGSDTTAVAISAALEADKCDIYTDVDGVFTADPRIVDDSKQIKSICYEEMLELASRPSVSDNRKVSTELKVKLSTQDYDKFVDGPAGRISDFHIERFSVMTNGVKTFYGKLEFAPGCGAYITNKPGDGCFPVVYEADTNAAFLSSIPFSYSYTNGCLVHVERILAENECMVLRTRSVANETGVITNCNYSKITGPMSVFRTIRFHNMIFNPNPNDPNLEFDVGNNLSRRGDKGCEP